MTNEKPQTMGSELCNIRIMFPVNSDDEAIEYKKKIAVLLADIPDATIQFSLMKAPPQRGQL